MLCYDHEKGAVKFMIKRELYMSRIRPFIGTELIKIMTGIRRICIWTAISRRV